MKSISLVNKKGGVGKSTTLALLAVYFAKKGKKVGVIDKDANQDSVTFVENLGHESIEIYNSYTKDYDYVLIDTGGGVDASEAESIEQNSDLILIPTDLDMLEIKNSVTTTELFKSKKKVRIIFTRLQKNTQEYKQLATIRSAFSSQTIKCVVHSKKQYKRVVGNGYGALAVDGIKEMQKLYDEIRKLV